MSKLSVFMHLDAWLGVIFSFLVTITAIFSPIIAPYDPLEQEIKIRCEPPSSQHLFGTDQYGRDVLSRIIHGARYSLMIAVSSISVALIVGSTIGACSAYWGGAFDTIVVNTVNFLMTFPTLILAMLITAVLTASMSTTIIAIAVAFVPRFIRLIRASVLVVKEEVFILASRSLGQRDWKILLSHVIPNSLSTVTTMGILWLSTALLAEASLSFLGLGVQPPIPSWGSMIREGLDYITSRPHLTVFPSIAISLAVFGFNLLGDRLQEFYNPKLRSRL